jgi:SAM-dependent methyltransferase
LVPLIRHLEPLLPNFRFSLADIHALGYNLAGAVTASAYHFPFAAAEFDAAVVSSVFTHMLADEIENYVANLGRVMKPDAPIFITALLFDGEAERAVAQSAAALDFRHHVGPCITFDCNNPREGIAFPEAWLTEVLRREGFEIGLIQRGNWRQVVYARCRMILSSQREAEVRNENMSGRTWPILLQKDFGPPREQH